MAASTTGAQVDMMLLKARACAFCMGARLQGVCVSPAEPADFCFQTDLLTCPRCRQPSYCSLGCGKQAAQAHDVLCVDVATEEGAQAAAIDALIAALTKKDDPTEYARVVAAEGKLYGELFSGDADCYEAAAFPHIFVLGSGGFTRGSLRFNEYRKYALFHFTGRCRRDEIWMSWAACTQARLQLALRNERLHRPRGWDRIPPMPEERFEAFARTLVPREALAQGFAPGARVTLRGLTKVPGLNGTTGTLVTFYAPTQRWAVLREEGGKPLAVRTENLVVVVG